MCGLRLGPGFGGLGLHKIVSQAQSQKAGLAGPGFDPLESPGPGLGLFNIPGQAQSPLRPTLGLGLAWLLCAWLGLAFVCLAWLGLGLEA